MPEIRLFSLRPPPAQELAARPAAVEKSLQALVEDHLELLLGARLLASEFATGGGWRIDTLGLDGDGRPVVVEYKRALGLNIISQGLCYLDWLLGHRADFEALVRERLGADPAGRIAWSRPRLVCIAAEFAPHDRRAVRQIDRAIELLHYRRYGED